MKSTKLKSKSATRVVPIVIFITSLLVVVATTISYLPKFFIAPGVVTSIAPIATNTVVACPLSIDYSPVNFSGVSSRSCDFKAASRDCSYPTTGIDYSSAWRCQGEKSGCSFSDIRRKLFDSQKIYINNIIDQVKYCSTGKPYQCVAYFPEMMSVWLDHELLAVKTLPQCADVSKVLRQALATAYHDYAFNSDLFLKVETGEISPTFHAISRLTRTKLRSTLGPGPESSAFTGSTFKDRGLDSLVAVNMDVSTGRNLVNKLFSSTFWNSSDGLWKSSLLGNGSSSYHAAWDVVSMLNRVAEAYGKDAFNTTACANLTKFKQKLDSSYSYLTTRKSYNFSLFDDQDDNRVYCPGCSSGSDSSIDKSGEPLRSSDGSDSQVRYFSLAYRDFYFGDLKTPIERRSFNYQGLACNLIDLCPGLCTGDCLTQCARKPVISIAYPQSWQSATNSSSFYFQGSVNNASSVVWSTNKGTKGIAAVTGTRLVNGATNGSWYIPSVPLSEGENVIRIVASNGAYDVVQDVRINKDSIAPSAINNLRSVGATDNSVTLSWTAPGDDGAVGTATYYVIRYSPDPVFNWMTAKEVVNPVVPAVSGTGQSATIGGLWPNTEYTFGIVAADEAWNFSTLYRVIKVRTGGNDTTPPAMVTDLRADSVTNSSITLSWTAPGDDGKIGKASYYALRYSSDAVFDWGRATEISNPVAPAQSGTRQTYTITGLKPNTTYQMAINVADDVWNFSNIVGALRVTTPAQ